MSNWLDGERREAVNHKGWEVQWLSTRGWRTVNASFTTDRAEAIRACNGYNEFYGKSAEFRVYEVLE